MGPLKIHCVLVLYIIILHIDTSQVYATINRISNNKRKIAKRSYSYPGYEHRFNYDSFVPHDFYGQFIPHRRPFLKPSNNYEPFWIQDTRQDSNEMFNPDYWNFNHHYHNKPTLDRRPNYYDSSESEEDYDDKVPLNVPEPKKTTKISPKVPINEIEYPEESIPEAEYPEQSQNGNQETTTERNIVTSIRGRPVIVPTNPPDQIVFDDKPSETMEQRQCVQDCSTSSEYNPVCGTNNVTYFNPGKFKCARECGIDVFIKQNGRCPGGISERTKTRGI